MECRKKLRMKALLYSLFVSMPLYLTKLILDFGRNGRVNRLVLGCTKRKNINLVVSSHDRQSVISPNFKSVA